MFVEEKGKTAKEYLVEHGLQDTHWGRIIIICEKWKWFNPEYEYEAEVWISSAGGFFSEKIPRDADGIPLDGRLVFFNMCFQQAVDGDQFLRAAMILKAIHDRGKELTE